MVEAFYNLINLIGNTISETIKFLLDLKVCMVETFYNLINLITDIINKMICFLYNIDFETSIIDEVAIATAIGSLSFSIVIIIFLVQNISKNEEYRYSN